MLIKVKHSIPIFLSLFLLFANPIHSVFYGTYNIDGDFSATDDTPYWTLYNETYAEESFADYGNLTTWDYDGNIYVSALEQSPYHGFVNGKIKLSDWELHLNFSLAIHEVNTTDADEWVRIPMVFTFFTEGITVYFLEFDYYNSPKCIETGITEGFIGFRDIYSCFFYHYNVTQQPVDSNWYNYTITDVNSKFLAKYDKQAYNNAELGKIGFAVEFKNSNVTISIDDVTLYGRFIGTTDQKEYDKNVETFGNNMIYALVTIGVSALVIKALGRVFR